MVISIKHFILNQIEKYVKLPKLKDNHLNLAESVIYYLTLFQSWPKNNASWKYRLRYLILFCFFNIIMAGLHGHIVMYLSTNPFSFADLSLDITLLLIGSSGYQFCIRFFVNQNRAKILLYELGNFQKFDKPKGIELVDGIVSFICRLNFYQVGLVGPLLIVYEILQFCPDELDFDCGFIYPAYLPGVMKTYRRKVFVVFQVTSAFSYAFNGFVCSWFYLQISEYIVCYLKHLKILLRKALKNENFHIREKHLKKAVRYHQRILNFWKEYHDLAKDIFFIHGVITPVVLAMMVHTFIINFQVQYFVLFTMWFGTFFVVCFMGQRLISESETVLNVACEIIPVDGDIKTLKTLMLFIVRAQHSLYVPSGSIAICNYELFVIVCKTTYSYFTLIQTTSGMNT